MALAYEGDGIDDVFQSEDLIQNRRELACRGHFLQGAQILLVLG